MSAMDEKSEKSETRNERRRNKEGTFAADLRWVMGNVRGRRFMWTKMVNQGLFNASTSANAIQAALIAGARGEAAVQWKQIGDVVPDLRAKMLEENMAGFRPTEEEEVQDDG